MAGLAQDPPDRRREQLALATNRTSGVSRQGATTSGSQWLATRTTIGGTCSRPRTIAPHAAEAARSGTTSASRRPPCVCIEGDGDPERRHETARSTPVHRAGGVSDHLGRPEEGRASPVTRRNHCRRTEGGGGERAAGRRRGWPAADLRSTSRHGARRSNHHGIGESDGIDHALDNRPRMTSRASASWVGSRSKDHGRSVPASGSPERRDTPAPDAGHAADGSWISCG
jgi:hypothetical protein